MELTPQALRDVEFREKIRGYHPDDVDEFVERAFATADSLAERLRQTEERLRQLEHKAASGNDSDESLRRTLVLAQRTADAAIAEAQEQAASTIADAERRARNVTETADEQARRTAFEAQEQLRRDVEQLSITRAELQTDVDSLRRYLEDERNNHRAMLSEAIRAFEQGSVLNAPASHNVVIPPAPGEPRGDTSGDSGSSGSSALAGAAASSSSSSSSEDGDSVVDLGNDTMAMQVDDDPYFAELRRAVDDNEPLGPRDDEATLGDVHGEDLFGDDRRFLRRRR